MSGILSLASQLLGPLFKVVDQAVEDKDLALKIKSELQTKMLDQDSELVKAATSIITAEAQGESWLQRNWRPLTMLSFLGLIWAYWLGYSPDYVRENPAVVQEVFEILKLGITGYIVGRSAEKVTQHWKAGGDAPPPATFVQPPR